MNPDPLLRAVKTPWRRTFYPLGRPLLVETNDRLVLEAARASFGHFRPDRSLGKPIRLRLLRDPQATSAPPWPRPVYRGRGDLLLIACGDNLAAADLGAGWAVGFFSAAMLRDGEFFRGPFLAALVYTLLTRRDLTPVHAACVVRRGRGLCLCGPAGAGKTSLAYFAARRGYALLAEDAVYLKRSAAGLRLRGNAISLHFTVEARQLFPELLQWPVRLRRGGEECLVVPARKMGLQVAQECRPGAVVFLQRGSRPRLERVPARQAAAALYRSLPADEPRFMAAHRQAIAQLARSGAYRLGYRRLEEALELLEQIPIA